MLLTGTTGSRKPSQTYVPTQYSACVSSSSVLFFNSLSLSLSQECEMVEYRGNGQQDVESVELKVPPVEEVNLISTTTTTNA